MKSKIKKRKTRRTITILLTQSMIDQIDHGDSITVSLTPITTKTIYVKTKRGGKV